MKTLSQKRAAAGRRGGQSTLQKYGNDHFRKIGARGALITWLTYGLKPVGTGGYAMVNRETGKIKAVLNELPFEQIKE
jgi:hypothetical protein